MVREDILEGLKIAVLKGESLQQAMQSFFNAGYKKEEIEEAARQLQSQSVQQPIQPKVLQPGTPVQKVSSYGEEPKQKFSIYAQQPQKPKTDKLVIILLGVVLGILLLALFAVLLFKDKIAALFGG